MKLAIIGGGSSYTPELLDGLIARQDGLALSEVWMMDQDTNRLSINAGFARRMAAAKGHPFRVHETTHVREAVKDAKYVITQIRVGQMAARIADEKLGLRHGVIGQETTGVGGFANALRTIPRILDVAHAMEEVAPQGYLLNFTNPAGIVTEAIIKHSKINCVGLCNIPIGIIMEVIRHFGGEVEEVELDYVGLNHLSWVRGVKLRGEDITSNALEKLWEHAEEEWSDAPTRENMLLVMRSLKMYLNGYLQYFYSTDTKLAELKRKSCTRGEEVIPIEEALFQKYADPNIAEKPEELGKRGGAHYSTAAFLLMDAIEHNRKSRQIVCCRNAGAIPTFDDDAAVEVPAVIDARGATAIPQNAPEPAIRGLMQLIKAYESLTVEAAVHGDREAAFQALLLNPLTGNAGKCRELLEDLLEVNRPHLKGTFF